MRDDDPGYVGSEGQDWSRPADPNLTPVNGQDSTGHPLRAEYGFVTRAGGVIGGYVTPEDARLIGGSEARIVCREIGPWLDFAASTSQETP